MPSPKSGSPAKSSKKGSPDKSKSKKSPKSDDKKNAQEPPEEEEELVVPVPEGVMHRRMRFLLETKLKTDVEFLVGPEHTQSSIKAHKCMLAAESPVFEQLFRDCEEWKVNAIKQREEDARKIREEAREMELAIQNASTPKSKSPDKKGSPGKSPSNKSPKSKSPEKKSDKKSPKSSPKKSPQSKSGKEKSPTKGSPGKSSKGSGKGGSPPPAPDAKVNFYKDEVIGEDVIRVHDVHPLGFYRLLR